MFETRPVTQGLLRIFRLSIFLASIILHKILLWGGYVVQDKLKLFFFFQLLSMSTPRCAAFRRGGSVQSQELIWMEVCPPCHLRLPVQPGFMVGLPRTSPIASCVFLFCLHHQWDFHQCPQPTVSWLFSLQTKPPFLEKRQRCVRGGFTSLHHQLSGDVFSWLPWCSLWVSGEASEENPTEVWSQPLVCDSRDPPILRLAHCQLWEISNRRIW